MLTVILSIVVIVLILVLWRKVDDYRVWLGWSVVIPLAFFASFFPVIYGDYIARSGDVVQVYDITEIDDVYYYLDNGKWVDVLNTNNISQSDNLSVVRKKGLPSIWYWDFSYTETRIPIVEQK